VHCREFLWGVDQRVEREIGFYEIVYSAKAIHESLGRFLDDDKINVAVRVRIAARGRAK